MWLEDHQSGTPCSRGLRATSTWGLETALEEGGYFVDVIRKGLYEPSVPNEGGRSRPAGRGLTCPDTLGLVWKKRRLGWSGPDPEEKNDRR